MNALKARFHRYFTPSSKRAKKTTAYHQVTTSSQRHIVRVGEAPAVRLCDERRASEDSVKSSENSVDIEDTENIIVNSVVNSSVDNAVGDAGDDSSLSEWDLEKEVTPDYLRVSQYAGALWCRGCFRSYTGCL